MVDPFSQFLRSRTSTIPLAYRLKILFGQSRRSRTSVTALDFQFQILAVSLSDLVLPLLIPLELKKSNFSLRTSVLPLTVRGLLLHKS